MAIFDGIKYDGPISIDGAQMPHEPGVYLICTDSSGGSKIIGVYESADMNSSITGNPKRACWEKNKDGKLEAYYFIEPDRAKREKQVRRTVDDRYYKIACYDPPKDDF